jgi:hypothetical protein
MRFLSHQIEPPSNHAYEVFKLIGILLQEIANIFKNVKKQKSINKYNK